MEEREKAILFILNDLGRMNQEITISSVIHNLELLKSRVEDIGDTLELLQNKGLLRRNNNHLTLTEAGLAASLQISKEKTKQEFSDYIFRASSSKAYLDYCTELYGYRMCLFNMMDQMQLDFLFNSISITKNDTILDLGCGNGCILNFLTQKYGCHGVGIDQLDALEIKKFSRQIDYIAGNIDELEADRLSPNIIISVDSLYFSNDLNQLLKKLNALKNTRFYLYYSQYIFDKEQKDKNLLNGNNTRLAVGLNYAGIKYRTIDYSKNESELYESGMAVLPRYEGAFELEGNRDIYEKKVKETKFGKELYESGCASRFLYVVE